jgi:signal transduction histidine kinase
LEDLAAASPAPTQSVSGRRLGWWRVRFVPSVSAYLILGITLLIIGLMALTTLLDIRSKRDDEQAALRERGGVLATAAGNVLAPSIRTGDAETVNELTRVIWGQEDVGYVKVFDADGQLLVGPGQDQFPPAGIHDETVPASVTGFRTNMEFGDGYLNVTAPAITAAEVVGFVQFGLDTSRIDSEIADLTASRIRTTLLLIAVGAVLSVAMTHFILQPMRKLLRATESLAQGNLSTRVEPLRGREMQELGNSFNRMADELQTMIRELQESRLRIVSGQESVRREIATHLHGSVQGSLLAMRLELEDLARQGDLGPEATARVERISQALSDVTQTEIADVSRRLYPAIIRRGLAPSMRSLVDRFESSLSIDLQIDERLRPGVEPVDPVPEQTRLAVYRIADEALTNALKHAPKSHVAVEVRLETGAVVLTVRDDGPGFNMDAVAGGLGLTAIQDHAGAVGGIATLTSELGRGTEVRAVLPLGAGL